MKEKGAESNNREGIEDMIARAQNNPNAIIYGTFHTWDRKACLQQILRSPVFGNWPFAGQAATECRFCCIGQPA